MTLHDATVARRVGKAAFAPLLFPAAWKLIAGLEEIR